LISTTWQLHSISSSKTRERERERDKEYFIVSMSWLGDPPIPIGYPSILFFYLYSQKQEIKKAAQ